jgi:hypothetical protein
MDPRKKSKPNNTAAPASSGTPEGPPDAIKTDNNPSTASGSTVLQDASSEHSTAESAPSAGTTTPTTTAPQTPRGKKWLSGTGSWRSKAPAVAKIAKESIGVSGGAAGELPSEEAKKPKDDSPKKFLTKRKSSKSDAIPAAMTKVNVSSDGLVDEAQKPKPKPKTIEEPPVPMVDEPPLPPEPPKSQMDAAASTWAWRSWWSRPDGYPEAGKARSEAQSSVEEAQTTPLPGPTPSEEPDEQAKGLDMSAVPSKTGQAEDVEMKDAPSEPVAQHDTEMKDAPATTSKATRGTSGSWFWSWSNAQNVQANLPPVEPTAEDSSAPKPVSAPEAPVETAPPQESSTSNDLATPAGSEQATTESASVAPTTPGSSKPSAWAFWYTGKPGDEKKPGEAGPQKHVGEVAVFDTPSQSNPEAAQFNEQEQPKTHPEAPTQPRPAPKSEPLAKRSFNALRGSLRRQPKTNATSKDTPTDTPSASETATPTKTSLVQGPTRPETAHAAQPAPKQATTVKQGPKNLVLPEFKTTYQLVQQPNFWQQMRRYFLGGEPATPHLHINPAPPKIKKAVAIGIHGFFPAPIIQKVLGQPTGTSIRFANAAAAAIKDWSEARGYSPEIEQIALEGEGFIAERVNSLWKLLLNWIDHIKQADFILVACHSQGVPVATMLVAKLIQFGCVNASRIGICAMAGVNMGPFIEYKTKYFGPTAAELFEFSNPKSLVSQMYLAALDEVLRFGVRILYVGSIDDQLVSLEVSISPSSISTLHILINVYSHPPSQPSHTRTSTAPSSSTAASTRPTS